MFYVTRIDASNFNTPSYVIPCKTLEEARALAVKMAKQNGASDLSDEELNSQIDEGYWSFGDVTIAWGTMVSEEEAF